mmetsp:Transcript_23960/g.55311  ORF Transcript_23960/g.55311 Transcript_23960/m.55311 type:complete len:620 (-) Transcript_23960:57-1916(-)
MEAVARSPRGAWGTEERRVTDTSHVSSIRLSGSVPLDTDQPQASKPLRSVPMQPAHMSPQGSEGKKRRSAAKGLDRQRSVGHFGFLKLGTRQLDAEDLGDESWDTAQDRWSQRMSQRMHGLGATSIFAPNRDDMKASLKENMSKKAYDVRDLYKSEGLAQKIARSSVFEHTTLFVICCNAIWISVDTDHNDADVLLNAKPVFIVAENLFCVYFSFEWLMRLLAFEVKLSAFRDSWFLFDSALVALMVLETWIMVLVLWATGVTSSGALGNSGLLRMLRLLRLSRMARMARLLRSMPELVIMIKGMVAGIRSVFFTLILLSLLIYVFAIAFRQLAEDTVVGAVYFKSVLWSMQSLLISCVLLDEIGDLVELIEDDQPHILSLLYFFIVIAALMVMNMLIGVLCEVVSTVARTEQENLTIAYTSDRLKSIVEMELHTEGEDNQEIVDKNDFIKLFSQKDCIALLSQIDVDVFGLIDLVDTIFADETGRGEKILSFGELLEVMLQQRSTQTVSIRDVTTLRKFFQSRLDILEQRQNDFRARLEEHLTNMGGVLEKHLGCKPGRYVQEVNQLKDQCEEALSKALAQPGGKISSGHKSIVAASAFRHEAEQSSANRQASQRLIL